MSQKSLPSQPATKKTTASVPTGAATETRRRKLQSQKAKLQAAPRGAGKRQVAPILPSPKTESEILSQQAGSQEATKPIPPESKPVSLPVLPTQPASRPASVPVRFAVRPIAQPQRRWPLWLGVVGVLLLMISGGAFGFYQSWQSSGRIAPNLFIAGQPVGDLTRDEALEKIKAQFGDLDIKIVAPDKKWHLPIYNLGGALDANRAVNNAYWFGRSGSVLKNVPQIIKAHFDERHLNLGVRWNKQKLKNRMRAIAADYKRPARNAALQVGDTGVQILPETTGRALNVGATLWHLQKRYNLHHTTINAKVQTVKPRLTAADLAGSDVKIGSYTTRFNRGEIGRTRNLHVASQTINGKVLMPGETFSFNASTGERTWEKGYRMAHIFERKPGKSESEVVDGLAGGVCQVSTTLYNAVRRGNQKVDAALKIVQRETHSLPVTYVSSGMDATVAWPSRDFKFKNTLPHPIYMRAAINGSRITMSVWARMPHATAAQFAQNASEKPRG